MNNLKVLKNCYIISIADGTKYRADDEITLFDITEKEAEKQFEKKRVSLGYGDGKYYISNIKHITDEDVVEFEGKEMRREFAEHKIAHQKVLQKIENSKSKNFVILNGYVGNSMSFWAKGDNGYTTNFSKIEIYSKKEILKKFKTSIRKEDIIIPYIEAFKAISTIVNAEKFNHESKISLWNV